MGGEGSVGSLLSGLSLLDTASGKEGYLKYLTGGRGAGRSRDAR